MISIVICSVNGAKFAAVSNHYRRLMADEPHEIIGIHDAVSMCDGYNRGFAHSKGDTLIFSHDDVEILTPPPDFTPRLKAHMQRYDVVGVAGTDRLVGAAWFAAGPPFVFGQVAHVHPKGVFVYFYGVPRRVVQGIQAMDGLFLAFRREVVEKLQWDDKTFTGWHCYDIDMVFRAHLAGYKTAVACDMAVLHASSGEYGDAWQVAAKAFLQKHAGKFSVVQPLGHQFAATLANSREDALKLMTPRYWDEP
ncbi:MAG: glycosyltransferase family protein [Phycisphaerales bacterium]|nr:glycosyltransferase family protein [Phycisphaerales bacterium]